MGRKETKTLIDQLSHIVTLPIVDPAEKRRSSIQRHANKKEMQIMVLLKLLMSNSEYTQSKLCETAIGVGKGRASNIFNLSSPERGGLSLIQVLLMLMHLGHTLEVVKLRDAKWDGSITPANTEEDDGMRRLITGDRSALLDALESAEKDKGVMRRMIDDLISSKRKLEDDNAALKKSLAQPKKSAGGGCAETM